MPDARGDDPAILIVDDDPQRREPLIHRLERMYGNRYRLLVAAGAGQARETLRELDSQDRHLAMVVAAQELAGDAMGADVLHESARLHSAAKRVLYMDTAEACPSREVGTRHDIDFCAIRPFIQPEAQIDPMIETLLDQWEETHRQPRDAIRVVGYRWAPESHDVRDFLARSRVRYRFLDLDRSKESQEALREAREPKPELPLVLFPDGRHLTSPTHSELANALGLQTNPSTTFFDLIVLGAGPAGLAAAVYAASEGLRVVLVEKDAPGGQAATSARIENYLGFPAGLSGADLIHRAVDQARRFGAEMIVGVGATGIEIDGAYRTVELEDGRTLTGHTILVATGVAYRTLDVPGARELSGSGVYYGAVTAEIANCREQHVCVLGGGNSAGQAAMRLSHHAKSVTLISHSDSLEKGMSQYLVERIRTTPNITVRLNATVTEVVGHEHVEAIRVQDVQTKETNVHACDSLFVYIGARPRTDWLPPAIARDERGFLLTGRPARSNQQIEAWDQARDPYLLETSIPGVFAAGDVRSDSIKRITSAVGEGAMTVSFVHDHLDEK